MGKRLVILLVKLAINALTLIAVTGIFHGRGIWVEPAHLLGTTIAAAVLLALVNSYLRPLVIGLTLPLNILTLGLFTLVINAGMLKLVSWLLPAFHVDGFWCAVGGALLISVISTLLNWFLRPPAGRIEAWRR